MKYIVAMGLFRANTNGPTPVDWRFSEDGGNLAFYSTMYGRKRRGRGDIPGVIYFKFKICTFRIDDEFSKKGGTLNP